MRYIFKLLAVSVAVGAFSVSTPAMGANGPNPESIPTPEQESPKEESRRSWTGKARNTSQAKFNELLSNGDIDVVMVDEKSRTAYFYLASRYHSYQYGGTTTEFIERLEESGVGAFTAIQGLDTGTIATMFIFALLICAGLLRLAKNSSAPGGGPAAAMRGKTKKAGDLHAPDSIKMRFSDVAGVENAKFELMEVVDFLKNPKKYTDLGAKIPKGTLLEGPPGTGKTLLAKAVAGEAGVPFISASGAEFVEMFVGVGASRVRDLFAMARANAPCIVFIDEINALLPKRDDPGNVSNDERKNTVDEFLKQMDGFENSEGVILIGATNHAHLLDSAALRAGRFDRKVTVPLPTRNDREAILEVHASNKPLAPEVDLAKIAGRTFGYSGADLANLLNEAAIFAARRNAKTITNSEVEAALELKLLGRKVKGARISEKTRRLVAYHEAGHAITGFLVDKFLNGYSVSGISILAREGGAGGVTTFNGPDEDCPITSYKDLVGRLVVAYGGRAAEMLVAKDPMDVTAGASQDFEQATSMATHAVHRWGLGTSNFFAAITRDSPADFVQRASSDIEYLLEGALNCALDLLGNSMPYLHALAELLLEVEAIDGDRFEQFMQEMQNKYGSLKVEHKFVTTRPLTEDIEARLAALKGVK